MTILSSNPGLPASMTATVPLSTIKDAPFIQVKNPDGSNMAPPDAPDIETFPQRHPATSAIFRHFEFGHLPPHLAEISHEVHTLAHSMVALLPDGPELTMGLRKLLEAKDCLVRAAIR